MHIKAEPLAEVSGVAIAILSQKLVAANVKEFKDEIQPYLDQHRLVVIEMQSVTFVDSSGISAMIHCLRKMIGKQGELKLVGLTQPVRALFELVRMHEIFPIAKTREEALTD